MLAVMTAGLSSIHASAVLVGAKAVLIRGPSGAGKSRLAWQLLQAHDGRWPFVRLVADDRAYVDAHRGRLIVRPVAKLAGLIEIRGLGILRLPYEAMAVVGSVIDLGVEEVPRHPDAKAKFTTIKGITLPRLSIARPDLAFSSMQAFLMTLTAGIDLKEQLE